MRKDCEEYLIGVARSIVGSRHIEFLRASAKTKIVPNQIICQFFIHKIRQVVANMNPSTLGRIGVSGSNFEEDGMLNRAGSNIHVHVPALYEYDSGRTIMEKLATVTILSAIRHLVYQGQKTPTDGEKWLPIELAMQAGVDLDKFSDEDDRVVSETGW